MVNPDQTKLLRDTLHVIINEGDDLMFPTTAVGSGQLVTCEQSSTGVDFGHQFVGESSLHLAIWLSTKGLTESAHGSQLQ